MAFYRPKYAYWWLCTALIDLLAWNLGILTNICNENTEFWQYSLFSGTFMAFHSNHCLISCSTDIELDFLRVGFCPF